MEDYMLFRYEIINARSVPPMRSRVQKAYELGTPLADWSRMQIGEAVRFETKYEARSLADNAAKYGVKLSARFDDSKGPGGYTYRIPMPVTGE